MLRLIGLSFKLVMLWWAVRALRVARFVLDVALAIKQRRNAPKPDPKSAFKHLPKTLPVTKTMSSKITHINDESFAAEVLNASGPVLIDYWAEWCGPCKMIAPLLDEIANEYDSRVKVVKLNVEEHPETASKYGIRSIPTLMLFKDGNVEATKVGAVSKSQLTDFIESNINNKG